LKWKKNRKYFLLIQKKQNRPIIDPISTATSNTTNNSENVNATPPTEEATDNSENNNLEGSYQLNPEEYIWFGVGCDGCGIIPIKGKRYKCKDCSEQVGYDLCETCYKTNVCDLGRYNQSHLSTHVLEEVPQQITLAHIAQSNNPLLFRLLNYMDSDD